MLRQFPGEGAVREFVIGLVDQDKFLRQSIHDPAKLLLLIEIPRGIIGIAEDRQFAVRIGSQLEIFIRVKAEILFQLQELDLQPDGVAESLVIEVGRCEAHGKGLRVLTHGEEDMVEDVIRAIAPDDVFRTDPTADVIGKLVVQFCRHGRKITVQPDVLHPGEELLLDRLIGIEAAFVQAHHPSADGYADERRFFIRQVGAKVFIHGKLQI